MSFVTKRQIAEKFNVSPRCVDLWRDRGLLPAPIKFGDAAQSRVRWPASAVVELERNLTGQSARETTAT